ncbi:MULTISPECIES: hypothetical protein [unclassified Aureimonas]|uniref:hypothetical protein n=1 Tax=unclassified Aureimonas TaxID=2615206 RepID=UPI0006FAFDFB|nr:MULTISPECIES: hypothetical protein [unclassified Aureimonas]KQT60645.1 hypothetical protein ASG54_24605 [Aureimonas sp. Leaf460]KQT68774.1 hypothetical protein ASG62_18125 [Aureimonas sp. Leaf427]
MSNTPKPDLLDNMSQRTDNDFNGVRDDSLIGQDLPDDEAEDESAYGGDELAPERSQDPKSI